MKFKIPSPKLFHDVSQQFSYNQSMCGSCAYHIAPSEDEILMERDMRMLRPERHHACHERRNSWCKGSVEFQKIFEEEKK